LLLADAKFAREFVCFHAGTTDYAARTEFETWRDLRPRWPLGLPSGRSGHLPIGWGGRPYLLDFKPEFWLDRGFQGAIHRPSFAGQFDALRGRVEVGAAAWGPPCSTHALTGWWPLGPRPLVGFADTSP